MQLDDQELIAGLKRCVAQDRRLTARLLVHFAEVDARGLYRDQGYESMFDLNCQFRCTASLSTKVRSQTRGTSPTRCVAVCWPAMASSAASWGPTAAVAAHAGASSSITKYPLREAATRRWGTFDCSVDLTMP
jgi:hypothetical protein